MAVFTDKLSHMDSSLKTLTLLTDQGNSSPGRSEVLAGWGKGTEFQRQYRTRHLNVVL